MSLRTGITTGTCAAAAAKAATMVLCGGPPPCEVDVPLPGDPPGRIRVRIECAAAEAHGATASVRKDAGDDPDVTDKAIVQATVAWRPDAAVTFAAGEGVGTVTRGGLQLPPGEPAINPGPRAMIAAAVREVTPRGVLVTVAVPGGRELAAATFNPRLGIEGGLSILGTTGIVRPYCRRAVRETLRCQLDVAAAGGIVHPVFVPGNIGAAAARRLLSASEQQVIEVGNAWDVLKGLLLERTLDAATVVGHPGKLAKLIGPAWDTHSARSPQAVASVAKLCEATLRRAPQSSTVEGIFAAIEPPERTILGNALAGQVRAALAAAIPTVAAWSVGLVNMQGELLGSDGALS